MPVMVRSESANIAENIRHLAVPIDGVRAHPENPRRGDVEAIMRSLEQFGQYKPIVVQARGDGAAPYIVAGNHTWLAARALGWSEIAALEIELSDERARAILLADNRTSDLGTYDDVALLEIANALDGELLMAAGYDAQALRDIGSLVGPVPGAEERRADLPDVDEKARRYLESGIRQLVLHFEQPEYEQLIRRLNVVMRLSAVDTHAEAVVALLDDFERTHAEALAALAQEPEEEFFAEEE